MLAATACPAKKHWTTSESGQKQKAFISKETESQFWNILQRSVKGKEGQKAAERHRTLGGC